MPVEFGGLLKGALSTSAQSRATARTGRPLLSYLNFQDRSEDDLLLRRTFSGIALVTVGAVAAALLVQAPDFDPLDRIMLPLIALVNTGLALWLRLGRINVRWAILTAYLLATAYMLLAYNHQFNVFVPIWGLLSENTYWFAALAVAAFVAFPTRLATQFITQILMVVVLITGWHVVTQPELFKERQLVGNVAQFLLVGGVIAYMQSRFGAMRDRMQTTYLAAYRDALTGLANRRASEEHLQALHTNRRPYTVVMFDLDHFKSVNDNYGHATGDRVLIGVAQTVTQVVGDAGLVARWGGEEFLLVLTAQPEADLRTLLQEVQDRLRTQSFGPQLGVTACFGVAHAAPDEAPDAVIHRADTAMYFVKHNGRNAVNFASQDGAFQSA